MAVDLDEYEKQLEEHAEGTARVLNKFRERLRTRDMMQTVADGAANPDLALDADQKTALLADQLAETNALQASLTASVAALT